MKEQFVPYEIALKLKEKHFNEQCLAFFNGVGDDMLQPIDTDFINFREIGECVAAPLWQQVIDWFENNHIWINITPPYGKDILFEYTIYAIKSDKVLKGKLGEGFDFKTKFEAREAAINHALTLI